MKFLIETFGCQMNEHDSLKMASILRGLGHEEAKSIKDADVIIVNTCAVRKKAEEKFYSLMGRLKRIKRNGIRIGVTGCIAQMEKEALKQRLPFVDFCLGPSALSKIGEAVEKKEFFDLSEEACQTTLNLRVSYEPGVVKAYVSIMKGCDNFCSYCIVPYVRGRQVDRPSKEVIQEIEELAQKGVKEVTLLGQNVNAYNKGKEDLSFPELLKRIEKIDGIERVRFVTSHPKDLSIELIELFGSLRKLCEHIHLPFQSGSDKILQLMNRQYKIGDYRQKVELLRRYCKDIAITADCIVGFPGETEEDFLRTLELVKEIQFDGIFSFIFSPRKYTRASLLPDPVPKEIALERLAVLQALQREITLKKNRAMEGKEVEVLVDGRSRNSPKELQGRTRTNKIVNFPSESDITGELVFVRIVEGFPNSLRGELIN